LISALGAADLRPARVVAEDLEKEAGALWRTDRRGHQELRLRRERLRELEAHRRDLVDADRTLRDRVREQGRVHAELEAVRVERVTARVTAAGWMRARAGQLEHELRELGARLEHEAAELFETAWARLDADRVRALPAAQLRTRARDLDDARGRTQAQREAARQ